MNSRLLAAFVILHSSFDILSAAPPPELTVLRTQYDKVVAERVTAVFDASKAALDSRFTAALDNAIAASKTAGELKAVLALEAEKKRLADKLPLPAEDDEATPEALKKLRAIYRGQLTKLDEARTSNHSALLPAYSAKLAALEVTLTKADRVAEAAEVLAYREGLTACTPFTSPLSAGTSTPAARPATPAPQAPRLSKAEKASNSKRLKDWALANGHSVIVNIDNKELRIEPGGNVPAGESTLIAIHRVPSVPGVNEPPPWDAFAGQEELRQLFLADWKQPVKPAELGALAYLPSLNALELNFTSEGSPVESLPELPKLLSLKFKPHPSMLGSELAALARKTPSLTELLLDRVVLTDEEFAAVKGWKTLTNLILAGESTILSEPKCDALASMPGLEKIFFYACRPDAVSAAGFSKLKFVTRLQFNYNLSRENLEAALAVPNLSFIGFSDVKSLTDTDLETLSKATRITEIQIRNSPSVTDAGLAHLLKHRALARLEIQRCPGITAAAFQSLNTLKQLSWLVVHQTAFDDAALTSLTRSRSLKDLGLFKTSVTDEAVKAFQKARPDVNIDR